VLAVGNVTFDKNVAFEALEGNEEMFETMVEMFLDLLPEIISEIRKGSSSNNADEAFVTAVHTLKSRSLFVGGAAVSACSFEIEALAKTDKADEALALVPELLKLLDELVEVLQEL